MSTTHPDSGGILQDILDNMDLYELPAGMLIQQGPLVRVIPSRNTQAQPRQHAVGPRGKNKLFTRRHRKRMLNLAAIIDWGKLKYPTLLVTLAYPDDQTCMRRVYRNFRAFWARLLRRHKAAMCLWRVEPQKNGRPHFHLLILEVDAPPGTPAADALRSDWNEIAGGGAGPGETGFDLRIAHDPLGAAIYMSKRFDTADLPAPELWEGIKHWGQCRLNLAPKCPPKGTPIIGQERMKKYQRRVLTQLGRRGENMTLASGNSFSALMPTTETVNMVVDINGYDSLDDLPALDTRIPAAGYAPKRRARTKKKKAL